MNIAPAPYPILAIVYSDGLAADRFISDLGYKIRDAGIAVAGIVQHNNFIRDRTKCDMEIEELASRTILQLSEDRGKNARGCRLVLLRHKFIRTRRVVEARQHGHRGRRLTRASMMRRRTVAIEFGTWRSGRNGGSSGSVTAGNVRLREPRGGTRS